MGAPITLLTAPSLSSYSKLPRGDSEAGGVLLAVLHVRQCL